MEFVCPDPNATVRAANVRATLDAFKLMPSAGERLINRHNLKLDDLRPDNVVKVQSWLDALQELQREVGTSIVRQVGARIIENAEIPPVFKDVESFLFALDDVYHMNHQGDVGHYRPKKRDDGSIEVRCETPYPRHFEHGLIEGITRNPNFGNHAYRVQFIDGPTDGPLTCTLIVTRKSRDG